MKKVSLILGIGILSLISTGFANETSTITASNGNQINSSTGTNTTGHVNRNPIKLSRSFWQSNLGPIRKNSKLFWGKTIPQIWYLRYKYLLLGYIPKNNPGQIKKLENDINNTLRAIDMSLEDYQTEQLENKLKEQVSNYETIVSGTILALPTGDKISSERKQILNFYQKLKNATSFSERIQIYKEMKKYKKDYENDLLTLYPNIKTNLENIKNQHKLIREKIKEFRKLKRESYNNISKTMKNKIDVILGKFFTRISKRPIDKQKIIYKKILDKINIILKKVNDKITEISNKDIGPHTKSMILKRLNTKRELILYIYEKINDKYLELTY